jgi:hypothetical protein
MRTFRRWEDNIKIDLKIELEMRSGNMKLKVRTGSGLLENKS